MPRLLLTTVLALTQLLSWSGAPVYLCLGCDGSVAIDFGPAGCKHCKHAKRAATLCKHNCTEHRRPAQLEHYSALVHACGCKHIQLSEPNSPVVVRAQRSATYDRSLTLVTSVAVPTSDLCANPPALGLAVHWPDRNLCTSSTALISSVVLRC